MREREKGRVEMEEKKTRWMGFEAIKAGERRRGGGYESR
jgi:hypothetical protein